MVGLTLKDSPWGPAGWAAAKLWLFGLPVLWHLLVDRQRLSISPARQGGFGVAVLTGTLAAAGIASGYLLIGHRVIEAALIRKTLEPIGLTRPQTYIALSVYWIVINSVLEEYVFRWFIMRKCERLIGPAAAIAASAAIFVVHHSIAMAAYFPWWINLLASAAIFTAGAVWSWLYVRYRSIWVPYISHAIADVAIFALGGWLIFGRT